MHRRFFITGGAGLAAAAAAPTLASAMGKCVLVSPVVKACTVGLASSLIGPVAQRQQASEWCWAASLSMIFAYYGYHLSQESIVRQTWGVIANVPGQPRQIVQDVNRVWVDDAHRKFRVQGDFVTANVMTAAQDLNANNPLLIGALHHCMVLSAMRYWLAADGEWRIASATVRDPWPYNPGERFLTPQEWYNVAFLARIRVSAA